MNIIVAGNFIPLEVCPVDCTQNCIDALEPYCDKVWASLDPEEVKNCDVMILPGGLPDVNPAYWGEENTDCAMIDEALDEMQMKMIEEAVRQKKPVLGICRGYQLMTVYFGGTLFQDIKESKYHRFQPDDPIFHDTYCVKGTFMNQLYGDHVITNSAHHQAIAKMPDCMGISQVWISEKADSDTIMKQIENGTLTEGTDQCVIEAVYHKELPVIGVEWHPEMSGEWISKEADSKKLYDYLFSLVKNSMAKEEMEQ